jgi:hypothetical protein
MLRDSLYKLCIVWVCLLMCLVTPAFAVQVSDSCTSEGENRLMGNDVGGLSLKNKFNLLNNDSFLNKTKLITGLKGVKNMVVKSIINGKLVNSTVNTEIVNQNVNSDNTTKNYGEYNATRYENRSEIKYNTSGCLDELNTAYKSTCDSINHITSEISGLKSNITSINNEIRGINEELDNPTSTIDKDSLYITGLNEKRIELQESREELIKDENKLEKLNNLLKTKENQINNCKLSLNNLEKTEDKKTVVEDYNNHLKTINQINSGIKETNTKLTPIETNTKSIETTENNNIITTGTTEYNEIITTEYNDIITTETTENNSTPTTNNNITADYEITTTINDEAPLIHIAPVDYSTELYSTWGVTGGLTTIGLGMIASANAWRIYRTAVVDRTLISYTTHILGRIVDRAIPEQLTTELIEGNVATFSRFIDSSELVRAGVANQVVASEISAYTDMVSKLRSTNSGTKFLAEKLGLIGLEVEDTPMLVNKLLFLGSKEEAVGLNIFDVAKTFTKIKKAGTIELCKRCQAILYTGKVVSAFSVIMDIYTVASLVSWAGKGLGWWKKDYVNDYTFGLLFSLF